MIKLGMQIFFILVTYCIENQVSQGPRIRMNDISKKVNPYVYLAN